MNIDYLAVTELALLFAAAAIGLSTYVRDLKLKRADWLYQLFEKFYEADTYKTMRRIIDFPVTPEHAALKRDIADNAASDLHESFSDYLNFFEFILAMEKTGRLHRDEVHMLFEYYLKRLCDYEFILTYAAREGYENLHAYMEKHRISV
ncbi:MAG: hypothetical protein R8J41_09105 [Alphaproteobacteria bacterium]|uniref:hypothetical protein n=1 Tax=Pyruvatibacter sp. HU-CL02332 TaxID=3127650 RepID=UPI0029689C8D|nr:hypothetical protein [Alphaproteobacteria bacterium]